jgi:putative Holliday junction resolvase
MIVSIRELAIACESEGALMGLDLGSKTIGLAISDVTRRFAKPHSTLARSKLVKDIESLKKIIAERKIVGFVLGLPLNMDGTEGPRAQSTRAFARNLISHINLPLVFWDERLSTHEAERTMIEADLSRAKRAEKIDAAAAAIILQGALDRLQALNREKL